MTATSSLPRYNPWHNVYSRIGVPTIGSLGVTPMASVSGFPTMPLFVVPAPLPTLSGVVSSPLLASRQDFAQAVNVARLIGKFKGDGATKSDHHLKNFKAVMQAADFLDHNL
ncbi:hypothetical protein R1flu_017887 [Riccia fluitans]|uniref:Uncharacterized protein n=1 Tax=Riccia fluitans TaxID=41844 RepID=A0ABD1ZI78_9MARC